MHKKESESGQSSGKMNKACGGNGSVGQHVVLEIDDSDDEEDSNRDVVVIENEDIEEVATKRCKYHIVRSIKIIALSDFSMLLKGKSKIL